MPRSLLISTSFLALGRLKSRLTRVTDTGTIPGGAEFADSSWTHRTHLYRERRGPRAEGRALPGPHTTQRILFIGSF